MGAEPSGVGPSSQSVLALSAVLPSSCGDDRTLLDLGMSPCGHAAGFSTFPFPLRLPPRWLWLKTWLWPRCCCWARERKECHRMETTDEGLSRLSKPERGITH